MNKTIEEYPMAKKILIVDDEPVIRENLTELLSEHGYEIKEAESGIAAMKLIDKERFDLIISDVKMPDGDGMFLLEEVRENCSYHPGFILLTGFADISVEQALNCGADLYLSKPNALDVLEDKVAQILAKYS